MRAVKNDRIVLQYVKCKIHKICETAIVQNGITLQFVPDDIQTNEMCLNTVRDKWGLTICIKK